MGGRYLERVKLTGDLPLEVFTLVSLASKLATSTRVICGKIEEEYEIWAMQATIRLRAPVEVKSLGTREGNTAVRISVTHDRRASGKPSFNLAPAFPPIGREQEMNHMVFYLPVAGEILVDQLPDCRRAVYLPD